MIFLDTSVIVAYYLGESYIERVQEVYRRDAVLFLSELVEIEVFSVFSRLVRTGSMDIETARRTGLFFEEHLDAGLYTRIHLHADHYRWARDAIARFDLPLKAPDALHLAAAQVNGLHLVTADRQLARNAEALGIAFELIES